jgi:hypothetical protein
MATAKKTSKKKTSKKATKETTIVSMLIDSSGSMFSIAGATIEGCNSYVDTLKKELKNQDVYFSMIHFSGSDEFNYGNTIIGPQIGPRTFKPNHVKTLQVGVNINEAIKLSERNYTPSGGTPLIDASVKTILATDELVAKYGSNSKVIVVIQTDGAENMSTEYNSSHLKAMVEDRTAKGWSFVYLGAGINAFASASQYGFNIANTISYDRTKSGEVFKGLAQNSVMYASGNASTMEFGQQMRSAVGEDKVVGLKIDNPIEVKSRGLQK